MLSAFILHKVSRSTYRRSKEFEDFEWKAARRWIGEQRAKEKRDFVEGTIYFHHRGDMITVLKCEPAGWWCPAGLARIV